MHSEKSSWGEIAANPLYVWAYGNIKLLSCRCDWPMSAAQKGHEKMNRTKIEGLAPPTFGCAGEGPQATKNDGLRHRTELKTQFQSQIDCARSARARHQPECRITQCDVGTIEMRRVGGAVPIRPECQVKPLR